ncbi:MAG: hypothetical protein WB053_09735 [Nitrososphaeraceae archaeon]
MQIRFQIPSTTTITPTPAAAVELKRRLIYPVDEDIALNKLPPDIR